jgi:hypothetical protein
VVTSRLKFGSTEAEPCIMKQHPLFLLFLAYRFGLTTLAQLAINEPVTCESQLWREDVDAAMEGRLVLYCRQLRGERIELYTELVYELTQHELRHSRDRIGDTKADTCMSCTVARVEWTHNMMDTAIRRPALSAFQESYEVEMEPYSCSCDSTISWPEHKRDALRTWIRANKKLEELPSIPDWMHRQLLDNASLAP